MNRAPARPRCGTGYAHAASASIVDRKPAISARLSAHTPLPDPFWSSGAELALDAALAALESGDARAALALLALGARGARRLAPGSGELLRACVEIEPTLAAGAARVGLSGGSVLDRVRVLHGLVRGA